MLPIVANIYSTNPIQTPLVNTMLPGATVAHVPYDNVAPSVSNAQVENNTKGSSEAAAVTTGDQPPPEEAYAAPSPAAGDPANLGTVAQATFLAQLMGQDGSPATQGILVEYEKLVSISNVKYKPSNAMKPPPAPAGVFGKILQQEKASVRAVQPVQPLPEPVAAAAQVTPQAPVAAAYNVPAPSNDNTPGESAVPLPAGDTPAVTPAVINAYSAYAASAQRNAALTAELSANSA